MTDRRGTGHSTGMTAALALDLFASGVSRPSPIPAEESGARPIPRPLSVPVRGPRRASRGTPPGCAGLAQGEPCASSFETVYATHFDFVYRSVRRLGAPEHAVDDAVQDVFLVVHRRLADFEGRSSLRTWLFGIVLRVVRDHRRALARRRQGEPLRESLVPSPTGSPERRVERSEAARALHAILDAMDDDKRAVFVMAELEEMSAPEIAEATGANLNTVYSRLRAARADFEDGVKRLAARDTWRAR
jgi:RNA polymerase sigma-70 factor (ECF subfamily)